MSACAARPVLHEYCKRIDFKMVLFSIVGHTYSNIARHNFQNAMSLGVEIIAVHYSPRSFAHFQNISWHREFYIHRQCKTCRKVPELLHLERYGELVPFSHVWIVDDNVELSQSAILTMHAMSRSGLAYIAQPSIRNSHIPIVRPNDSCSYRYTDYVEVMAPVIHTCALRPILHSLVRQDVYSDWGLDMLWCKWSAAALNESTFHMCAVVDSVQAIKRRMIPPSYSYARALNDKRCTLRNMKPYKTQTRTFSCVTTQIF